MQYLPSTCSVVDFIVYSTGLMIFLTTQDNDNKNEVFDANHAENKHKHMSSDVHLHTRPTALPTEVVATV